MQEPIEVKLRSQKQIALARLQDVIVEAIIEVEPNIVFHGGTAIWRCYNGNRFSEDVDIYASDTQIKKLSSMITWSFTKRNVKMEYPLYTDRSVDVIGEGARSKFEAMKMPKRIKPVQAEYVRADGSKLFITSLSVKDFIHEKIFTYTKRHYVRDIYDIYHLASLGKLDKKTVLLIKNFLSHIEKPIDEGKLKDLVYTGIAPSFSTIIAELEKMIS